MGENKNTELNKRFKNRKKEVNSINLVRQSTSDRLCQIHSINNMKFA